MDRLCSHLETIYYSINFVPPGNSTLFVEFSTPYTEGTILREGKATRNTVSRYIELTDVLIVRR